MGKKLDALLGRNFRASKFKTLTKLAISRISILTNQRRARYSYARSDVVELLKLGHHDRALLRVEHVIKEQNMLDVFGMIEIYCHVLIGSVDLIRKNKECPDELKGTVSSLIFASSRCGEFPELMHIREILSSRFGSDFAARAVESRSNNGVNHKMMQKLSTGKLSLDNKLKMLEAIASEIGVTLKLEDDHPAIVEEKLNADEEKEELEPKESPKFNDFILRDVRILPGETILDEDFSESVNMRRKKYRDIAAAAQEAFESAACAAMAAKAAVELSRTESDDHTSDDENDSDGSSSIPEIENHGDAAAASKQKNHDHNNKVQDEKIHPIDIYVSESENEDQTETTNGKEESKTKAGLQELENHEDTAASKQIKDHNNQVQDEKIHPIDIYVSESENEADETTTNNDIRESEKKAGILEKIPSFASSSDSERMKPSLEEDDNEVNTEAKESNFTQDQHVQQQDTQYEDGQNLPFHSLKWVLVPDNSETETEKNPMVEKNSGMKSSIFAEKHHSLLHSNTERKWVSMRTRREHRA